MVQVGASLSAPLRFQHPRCRCQALWGGRRGEALLKVRACSEQAARLASIYCTSHMCRSRRSHMIAATRRRQRWQQKEKRRCLSIHVEVMISEPSASASDDNKEFYWYTTVGRQHGMSYARLTNPYFMPGGCFCAHRCCLESVMHARNRVSCVPSELGSTTVMVNYKCKLQHCSSRPKLKLCQGASCHCCTDALSWRCTSWCPSASGSCSSVRWPKGLARPRAAAAIHTLRTRCLWRPETALASSASSGNTLG
jgi:hypothetical protein